MSFRETFKLPKVRNHIKESVAKVICIIRGCKFITPSDINGEVFKTWMADKRNKGKSINAINGYLTSFKSFTRWMLKTGRLSENPIQYLSPLKKLERERPRRALTTDQINKLISKTIDADTQCGLTGYERSLVYRLALGTGLRYNEIYTLKRKDFTFGDAPCVMVQAVNAKNKKTDFLPLQLDLAKDLEQYFVDNLAMPHVRAFTGMWKDKGADTLRPDLTLAGIEEETEDGIIDFHSLRHTFGTQLALNGVSLQEAQKLMRHSDPKLTAVSQFQIGNYASIVLAPEPTTLLLLGLGGDFEERQEAGVRSEEDRCAVVFLRVPHPPSADSE